jgi:YfiH family protein
MSEQTIIDKREYCLFEGFSNLNLVCAFSTRHANNLSLEYGDTTLSLNNRKDFLGNLGIDCRRLVCAKQVHGDRVRLIKESDAGLGALAYDSALEDTDAFVTKDKNVPLAIFTADCLSVFLYDSKVHAIGLVHAGWRGSKEKIIYKAIDLMNYKFNTNPSDLYVGFGPSIRDCCLLVGRELNEFFPQDMIPRDNHYFLDLITFNKRQLLDLGVKNTNIFDSGICTSCRNDTFYSYRKEGSHCGRIMSVIMLE